MSTVQRAECVSSRGAALQASVAKRCMPPKALSRFAERGAGWRKPPTTSALDFSLRTKNAAQRTVGGACTPHSAGEARDRLWRSGSRPPISVNSRTTRTP